MFCSIFHKWSNWLDTESDVQIRWCENCNKRQRRLPKLKSKSSYLYSKELKKEIKRLKDG